MSSQAGLINDAATRRALERLDRIAEACVQTVEGLCGRSRLAMHGDAGWFAGTIERLSRSVRLTITMQARIGAHGLVGLAGEEPVQRGAAARHAPERAPRSVRERPDPVERDPVERDYAERLEPLEVENFENLTLEECLAEVDAVLMAAGGDLAVDNDDDDDDEDPDGDIDGPAAAEIARILAAAGLKSPAPRLQTRRALLAAAPLPIPALPP